MVDGVENLVGSLGDVALGLDDTKEGKVLSMADRIDREQTVFFCSLVEHRSAAATRVI